jgi:hypothetical protein
MNVLSCSHGSDPGDPHLTRLDRRTEPCWRSSRAGASTSSGLQRPRGAREGALRHAFRRRQPRPVGPTTAVLDFDEPTPSPVRLQHDGPIAHTAQRASILACSLTEPSVTVGGVRSDRRTAG